MQGQRAGEGGEGRKDGAWPTSTARCQGSGSQGGPGQGQGSVSSREPAGRTGRPIPLGCPRGADPQKGTRGPGKRGPKEGGPRVGMQEVQEGVQGEPGPKRGAQARGEQGRGGEGPGPWCKATRHQGIRGEVHVWPHAGGRRSWHRDRVSTGLGRDRRGGHGAGAGRLKARVHGQGPGLGSWRAERGQRVQASGRAALSLREPAGLGGQGSILGKGSGKGAGAGTGTKQGPREGRVRGRAGRSRGGQRDLGPGPKQGAQARHLEESPCKSKAGKGRGGRH